MQLFYATTQSNLTPLFIPCLTACRSSVFPRLGRKSPREGERLDSHERQRQDGAGKTCTELSKRASNGPSSLDASFSLKFWI